MPNYFYTDADGKVHGPFSVQHIQALIDQGVVTPTTPLETNHKHKYVGLAGQCLGLKFDSATQQTSSETSPGFFDIGSTRLITNTWTSIFWVLTIVLAILGCVIAIGFAFVSH